MLKNRKAFWVNLCLLNLCIVALLGFTLRSKILFSLPFIDYRNFLNAHSHFAFTGWAGLSLLTLLIYELLPPAVAQKAFYQWMLIVTEVCSIGMAITFPIWGYTAPSIIFSSLYILVSFAITPVFIKDLVRNQVNKTVRLLSSVALLSLVLSAIGPALLVYIIVSKSANAIMYRNALYAFLHFQYNGFFSLAVLALLLNQVVKKGISLSKKARLFALLLCLSVLPSMALSMLWQNNMVLYAFALIGCVLMLASLFYFFSWMQTINVKTLFADPLARWLAWLSLASFALKTVLNAGTIIPALGNAVYGDRPVIIGFLHLVFLGFISFYILAAFVEHGYFKKWGNTIKYPFVVFGSGIILNEVLLMLQGLGNLLGTTTSVFNWLLWGAAMLLLWGAILLFAERVRNRTKSLTL
ncbi:MAG TPA: hypothetical protein VM010_04410 [Chitinophagaceae bacterium]|nr:hypothetical protein [Chitinophagaceae bacterium]